MAPKNLNSYSRTPLKRVKQCSEGRLLKKKFLLLPFLLSSIFINYYMVATLDFDANKDANDPLKVKAAGPLGNNSILFDGMYYNWTGSFSLMGGNWMGNVTYTHDSGNTFDVYEVNTLMGAESYTINNQSRITTGGAIGSGTSTPYWIFTNVTISDYVPIGILMTGDALFQVTAIKDVVHKGTEYKCFVLNSSTSWALYEVRTGILIDSFFVWMSSYNYTMKLDATNAEFTLSPLTILTPMNQIYHYSEIPIIVRNKTVLDEVWFRNSSNGGIDWSGNNSLNYNGTHYINASNLWWEDGNHLLQVFCNTTDGNETVEVAEFSVDTYGPWIEILSPQNKTYCAWTPTIQLDIIVNNYTETHSAWFRYNTGSEWTQNSSLMWNGAEFVASLDFPIGSIVLQVYANDSQNHVSHQNLWFRYNLAGNSILFDGMYYNWTGEYSGGAWGGGLTYTHYSGNVFNVTETNVMGSIPPYTINNETRITTGGLFYAGTSTPYWIFNNISVSDYVPIAVDGSGDTNFQVTDIISIDYETTEIECFVLNQSTSWAYYEINTGLLIRSYFVYGGGNYYTINLDVTNVGLPPKPLTLLSPVNKMYYYSQIPIIVQNRTTIQEAWFRNSTNGGLDWSENYPLWFNGTYFTNASDLVWEDGPHLLQVYANTSTGRVVQESVSFTVDTYGPWIELINPLNITYSSTNITLRLDIIVQNFTYADSIWFRYNSGSGWSENQTLVWNSTHFLTTWRVIEGEYHLQIFGNNSLNQIAQRNLWFTYVEYKNPWNYTLVEGYTYTWEDATTGARCNMDGLDDQSQNFILPFTFDYYNESYNSMYVCTNGFVSFTYNTEWNNAPFPSSIYPYMIAPFWTDLTSANPCNIFVQNLTSPNRVVIEWQNIFASSGNLVGSFEIVLFESGDIVFNYDFLTFVPGYTCGLNFGPDTRFYTRFDELNNSIDDFSLLFSYPPNEFLPNLTNPSVNPSSGNQSTLFAFNMTYNDQDNNSPAYVKVIINGTPFNLEKVDIGDSNYVDGCDYTYCIYLQPGNYEYYFACCDGNYLFETIIFSSLSVERTNLSPPLLTDGLENPFNGYAGTTGFQFTVNYTDPDNNIPTLITLVINGTILAMNKQNLEDCNYMDGCLYTLNVTLNAGTYTYYYNCSDGDFLQWTETYLGPIVIRLNNAPQLTIGRVSPVSGSNTLIYQFMITYTDYENDAPVGGVLIYIDDSPHVMIELDPADTNYTDGKIYVYTTSLVNGNHQFYFVVSDGYLMATTEEIAGPSVYDLGEDQVPTPDYLFEFFMIVLIAAGIALTLETVILLRKRKNLTTKTDDRR